jgi:hypothetical protein
MRSSRIAVVGVGVLAALLAAAPAAGDRLPVRGDFPPDAGGAEPLPVCSGIPLPKGKLASADNVRLLGGDGREVPCQVTPTAYWPGGSDKWVLVDAVLAPPAAARLTLEYGPNVRRGQVPAPIRAEAVGPGVRVTGEAVSARIGRDGGILDECRFGGRALVAEGKPGRGSGPTGRPCTSSGC